MKYRIRCGDRYYCGMAYKDGQAFQKWEEKSPFSFPLEMNLTDAMCTLETLLETGKFTEPPHIEKIKEEKPMGFFSWITGDTGKSIRNKYSEEGPLPVYLYCPDGTKIYEPDYDGYGRFGGHDALALLAMWNCPGLCSGDEKKDRYIGISIENRILKYPLKFAESPDLRYEDLPPAKSCPYQGYFPVDEEDDE